MAKIIGTNIPNIPWEDKPAGFEYPVWRYSGNPVITRDNLHMANSIFNSAVVPYGSGFAGVFRADIRSRAYIPETIPDKYARIAQIVKTKYNQIGRASCRERV